MKIRFKIIITVLLFLTGCKIQEKIEGKEINIFNDVSINLTFNDITTFNLEEEPKLLETIKSFKQENDNSELEDIVILDFLHLQSCTHENRIQFQDYPNELQSIFNFYKSMSKAEMEWLNDKELKILKFSFLRFMVNYTHKVDGFEHLKNELKRCKNERDYADFVMESSNLNECIEKRE